MTRSFNLDMASNQWQSNTYFWYKANLQDVFHNIKLTTTVFYDTIIYIQIHYAL